MASGAAEAPILCVSGMFWAVDTHLCQGHLDGHFLEEGAWGCGQFSFFKMTLSLRPAPLPRFLFVCFSLCLVFILGTEESQRERFRSSLSPSPPYFLLCRKREGIWEGIETWLPVTLCSVFKDSPSSSPQEVCVCSPCRLPSLVDVDQNLHWSVPVFQGAGRCTCECVERPCLSH